MKTLLQVLKEFRKGRFPEGFAPNTERESLLDLGICALVGKIRSNFLISNPEASDELFAKVRRIEYTLSGVFDDWQCSGKIQSTVYVVNAPLELFDEDKVCKYEADINVLVFDLVAYPNNSDVESVMGLVKSGVTLEEVKSAFRENRLKLLDDLIKHLEGEDVTD